VHLPLGLRLLRPHVALSLRLLHSLRAHLLLVILRSLARMYLRLRVHCRAMFCMSAAATARGEHSRLGGVEVGVAAASTSESWTRGPWSESSMAAATATASLHRRPSRHVRVAAAAAATTVRTPAAVATARACVSSCGHRQGRSACEKNEPFHGETPYRSPAKRFANRPVPPFMCMKGEYRLLKLA
jgi:hypothetical protein